MHTTLAQSIEAAALAAAARAETHAARVRVCTPQARQIAEYLRQRGFEVTLCLPLPGLDGPGDHTLFVSR